MDRVSHETSGAKPQQAGEQLSEQGLAALEAAFPEGARRSGGLEAVTLAAWGCQEVFDRPRNLCGAVWCRFWSTFSEGNPREKSTNAKERPFLPMPFLLALSTPPAVSLPVSLQKVQNLLNLEPPPN